MSSTPRGPISNLDEKVRVVQRHELKVVDPSRGHNKFYRIDLCYDSRNDEYTVDATWGPIGHFKKHSFQRKGSEKDLMKAVDLLHKWLEKKNFKKGNISSYEMVDIKRWANEARPGEESCFVEEDWD